MTYQEITERIDLLSGQMSKEQIIRHIKAGNMGMDIMDTYNEGIARNEVGNE